MIAKPNLPKPVIVDEHQAAEYIGMSVSYLRADRARGAIDKRERSDRRTPPTGPAFLRFGRTVRYRKEDLDAWLERCRVDRSAPKNNVERKRTPAYAPGNP